MSLLSSSNKKGKSCSLSLFETPLGGVCVRLPCCAPQPPTAATLAVAQFLCSYTADGQFGCSCFALHPQGAQSQSKAGGANHYTYPLHARQLLRQPTSRGQYICHSPPIVLRCIVSTLEKNNLVIIYSGWLFFSPSSLRSGLTLPHLL